MVYICNFRPGRIWIAGTIVQVMSPISYMVEILSGHIVRRHLEHIKKRFADTTTTDDPISDITTYLPRAGSEQPPTTVELTQPVEPPPTRRTSSRARPPPNWYAPLAW